MQDFSSREVMVPLASHMTFRCSVACDGRCCFCGTGTSQKPKKSPCVLSRCFPGVIFHARCNYLCSGPDCEPLLWFVLVFFCQPGECLAAPVQIAACLVGASGSMVRQFEPQSYTDFSSSRLSAPVCLLEYLPFCKQLTNVHAVILSIIQVLTCRITAGFFSTTAFVHQLIPIQLSTSQYGVYLIFPAMSSIKHDVVLYITQLQFLQGATAIF